MSFEIRDNLAIDTPLNADEMERVLDVIRLVDHPDHFEVGLSGSVMVDIDGRHVGYLHFNGDTETTFSQRSSS